MISMEMGPDGYGRLLVPLPHGNVSLRVSRDHIELRQLAQHRYWLFWKRWRYTTLSEVAYRSQVGDTTTLTQRGRRWFVSVNDNIVLTYPHERTT